MLVKMAGISLSVYGEQMDSAEGNQGERFPLRAARGRGTRLGGAPRAHRLARNSARMAGRTRRVGFTRGDPGVGTRRARAEAVPVSPARRREGRAAEVLPRQ